MRFNYILVSALTAGLLAGASHGMRPVNDRCATAPAIIKVQASVAADTHPDRKLFDKLVADIRRIDTQYDQLMDKAVKQAQREDGHVSFETKARLLSLRDQHDRLHARLLILSSRHAWAIPELKTRTVKLATASASAKEINDRIFGSVDVLVQRRLTLQAAHIAEMVPLPVVTVECGPK